MSYIDAHVHVWTDDYERFPFADGRMSEGAVPLTFLPEEILALGAASSVDRIVLVQMSYYSTDNSYMLHVMDEYADRFSGIAIVNPEGEAPERRMIDLAERGVRGVRVYGRTNGGGDWLVSEGYDRMFRAGAEHDLAICALMNPDGLEALDRQCGRLPDTPVIIDHLCRIGASPEPMRQRDVDALCRLARHPRLMVKLSAFYALGAAAPPYADLTDIIRQVYAAYGPQRLMWASDCPYQVQDGHDYESSIALVREGLDFLSPSDVDQILRGTAEAFFFGSG